MMSLFTRTAARPNRTEPVLTPRREVRSVVDVESGYAGLATLAGMGSGTGAEGLGVVQACVQAVAGGIASLPVRAYRCAGAAGRVELNDGPLVRLLQSPNPNHTWFELAEFLVASVLLRGNALAWVERDGAGQPTNLFPIPWGTVSVQVLPSGRLAYDVVSGRGTPRRRYLAGEVLHIRDRLDDNALIGRSRLSRASATLQNAVSLQEYSTATWENSASPSGLLTVSPTITPAGMARVREQTDQFHAGAHNAKRIMLAENGSNFVPMQISPEDAEILASRRFSVEELCRVMGVPQQIVGDLTHGTFTNSAQSSLWFAQNTLSPMAKRIEYAMAKSVLVDPNTSIEIDLSGLTRGDFTARWQAWQIAVSSGVLDANEIREAEGYSPRENTQRTHKAL